jgi:hypothetical protein
MWNSWGRKHRIQVFGRKAKERPLERLICKWVDNIKMDLVDRFGWCGLNLPVSGSGQEERAYERGNELSDSIKCWETKIDYTTGGLLSTAQHHTVM